MAKHLIPKTCDYCGAGFSVPPYRTNTARFCSQRCHYADYGTLEGRFWSHVQKGEGCWIWVGTTNGDGYGWFTAWGRSQLAHRVAFILSGEALEKGQILHHRCENKACVRPDHLQRTTRREHIVNLHPDSLTGEQARRTHCPLGHPYDESNTYIIPSSGSRACRICRAYFSRDHRLRAQAAKRASR